MKEEFNAPPEKCGRGKRMAAFWFFFCLRAAPRINSAAILIKEKIRTSVRNGCESGHVITSEIVAMFNSSFSRK